LCRSDKEISEGVQDKISLFCDVDKEAVIPVVTGETIYEVPLLLEDYKLGDFIVNRFELKAKESNLGDWRDMVNRLKAPKESVTIGLVGKYVELRDAYYSVREALRHAALTHNREVKIEWLSSEELQDGHNNKLRQVQGIIVPGGFGYRGIEGMIEAARFAREKEIPYLGLCLGMQVMVIEFGRHAFHSQDVNSTEFNSDTTYPVIDFLPGQQGVKQKGGTMRLGTYPCHLVPGTKAARAYGCEITYERHRHRFEFNNSFRQPLEEVGMIASGLSPDGKLVEITELRNHPWMVSCQFHPEFRSRPDSPHPLFADFIGVAKETLIEGAQTSLPIS
jgi:CTP synthase